MTESDPDILAWPERYVYIYRRRALKSSLVLVLCLHVPTAAGCVVPPSNGSILPGLLHLI
jgi:hypothetical protein